MRKINKIQTDMHQRQAEAAWAPNVQQAIKQHNLFSSNMDNTNSYQSTSTVNNYEKQKSNVQSVDYALLDTTWFEVIEFVLSDEYLELAACLISYWFKHFAWGGRLSKSNGHKINKWITEVYELYAEIISCNNESLCLREVVDLFIDCYLEFEHNLIGQRAKTGIKRSKKAAKRRAQKIKIMIRMIFRVLWWILCWML